MSVVFSYLGAAEEETLLLFKLVRIFLFATLPAVPHHNPLLLHVLDDTEQPILACKTEIFSFFIENC